MRASNQTQSFDFVTVQIFVLFGVTTKVAMRVDVHLTETIVAWNNCMEQFDRVSLNFIRNILSA